MSTPRSPSEFVRAPLGDDATERMWTGVERAEVRIRRRRTAARVALAAVPSALVLFFVLRSTSGVHSASVTASATARSGAMPEIATAPAPTPAIPSEPSLESNRHIALAGGIDVMVGDQGHAEVTSGDVQLPQVRLDRGTAEIDVPVRAGSPFTVLVGDYEVETENRQRTHLFVSRDERLSGAEPTDAPRVTVRVEGGVARVRDKNHALLAFLGAGQSWTSDARAARPATRDIATAPKERALPSRSEAAKLFERASSARLAGQSAVAAATFDELRTKYPGDPRAGYAAFELGRIDLDALHDPRSAASAFTFAIAHPGPGFFVDDAQAGLVEALAKSGDGTACRRARDAFLSRAPSSAQAGRVGKQCDGL